MALDDLHASDEDVDSDSTSDADAECPFTERQDARHRDYSNSDRGLPSLESHNSCCCLNSLFLVLLSSDVTCADIQNLPDPVAITSELKYLLNALIRTAIPQRTRRLQEVRIVQITPSGTVVGSVPEPKSQIGGRPIAAGQRVCRILKAARCRGVPWELPGRRLGASAKSRRLKRIAGVPGSQQRRWVEKCAKIVTQLAGEQTFGDGCDRAAQNGLASSRADRAQSPKAHGRPGPDTDARLSRENGSKQMYKV
jgi:hypothetical protein